MGQDLTAIRINYGQQQHIPLDSMDMYVFDTHVKVIQRFFRPDPSEANELSGNTNRANSAVKQQVMDLHQPVDFQMVDDISLLH